MNKRELLAHRYAQAYFNVIKNELVLQNIESFKKFCSFLNSNRSILFFLEMAHISSGVKEKVLGKLFEHFNVPHHLHRCINLLLEHHRIMLLPEVLRNVRLLYGAHHNILFFTIISSHPLAEKEYEAVKKFLEHETHKTIFYESVVDPSLIAGIRLQSETYMWEHSIRKQYESLRQALAA